MVNNLCNLLRVRKLSPFFVHHAVKSVNFLCVCTKEVELCSLPNEWSCGWQRGEKIRYIVFYSRK